MNTTVLRWFQQVADGTTVTEISEIEDISQPGLSRALGRLETEVGSQLLVRSGRLLRTTRAGAAFKPYVDRALHELDDGLAAISAVASPDTGTVFLTYQRSFGSWLVPTLIADFRGLYPLVRFELQPINDDFRLPRFDPATDVAVTTQDPGIAGVQWRPMFSEDLALVVPAAHRLAAFERVNLNQVADDPFVMIRPTYVLRKACDELCRRAGFEPTIVLEADDLPTLEAFVEAGLGVAILPAGRHDLGQSIDANPTASWIRIDDPGASRAVGLAWSSERRLLPSASLFLESAFTSGRSQSRSRVAD